MEVLIGLIPEILFFLAALIFQLVGVYSQNKLTHVIAKVAICVACLLIAVLLLYPNWFYGSYLNNTFIVDDLTILLKITILVFYISIILIYSGYTKVCNLQAHSEYIVLIQISALAGLILVSANDFLTMFLSIEMQSIIGYVITTFQCRSSKSSEAALKYFIMSTVFSALMLFGISMLYGITQSIKYDVVFHMIQQHEFNAISLVAISMLLVGIFFKLSVVPFHMWTPDVYDGAPIVSVAYFASIPKISILSLLINILSIFFDKGGLEITRYFPYIINALKVTAIASLVVGGFGILLQKSLQRLIAYSSILNVGYVLLPLGSYSSLGFIVAPISYFYMISYVINVIGFIALVIATFTTNSNHMKISCFNALFSSKSKSYALITIQMLSFIGIPPFIGFFGKFFVLTAILEYDIISIITSIIMVVISSYCYLNIIKSMYFVSATSHKNSVQNISCELNIVAYTSIIAVVLLPVLLLYYPQVLSCFIMKCF